MDLSAALEAVALGLFSGYFSGQFGIGGGLITTPGIRLLIGAPPYVALGTPLLAIIPTTAFAAAVYARKGLVAWGEAKTLALWGLAGVVGGSFATPYISPHALMVATAAVILWVAAGFLTGARREREAGSVSPRLVAAAGVVCGLYSGLLGMGGGLLLIPALVRVLGFDLKRAFGTSLAVATVYAVPGAFIHWLLGHVDVAIAALIVAGVLPGVWLGARVALGMREELLRRLFGSFLLLVGLYFGLSELRFLAG